jgi:hypothetical protein
LVPELPPEHSAHDRAQRHKFVPPVRPDDDLVAIVTTTPIEAEMIVTRLRAEGMWAAVFGVGNAGALMAVQFVEGSRVMVRRADQDAAAKLVGEMHDATGIAAPISDETLAALADEAKGWSDPSSGAVV